MNGIDQVSSRQQRPAIATEAKRQWPGIARKLHQAREIAFDALTINQYRAQDSEGHAGGPHRLLRGKLGAPIGVDRAWHIGFPQDAGGGRTALSANRRHENEMADAARL